MILESGDKGKRFYSFENATLAGNSMGIYWRMLIPVVIVDGGWRLIHDAKGKAPRLVDAKVRCRGVTLNPLVCETTQFYFVCMKAK